MKLLKVFYTLKSTVLLVTHCIKQLIFIIILVTISNCISIAQTIEWSKCLGGSNEDMVNSIIKTNDGGYIVAGSTESIDGDVYGTHGSSDIWIIKFNQSDIIEWKKCYGGFGTEQACSINQTIDKGYIIAGISGTTSGDVTGNHGYSDFWILKINENGDIEWQKCFGGTEYDFANSVQITNDNGFVISGYTYSNNGDVSGKHGIRDYWIVKLNSFGNLEWQKCLGGTADDKSCSIITTSDDGYIVAGYSESNDGDVSGNHGMADFWIVKLNSVGGIDWQKCYGGTRNDKAFSIQKTNDNGYIIAGSTDSYNGDITEFKGHDDIWIIKISSTGTIHWQKTYGGSDDESPASILQSLDDGFVVIGGTKSNDFDITENHGQQDFWIVKLNFFGTIEWQKCLGGSDFDAGYSIIETKINEFIIVGLIYSNDGDISGYHGNMYMDGWIVKLSALTNKEDISKNDNKIIIYPNPTENMVYLETDNFIQIPQIKIYNIFGELITEYNSNISKIGNKIEIDLSGLSKGMYIMNIIRNEGVIVKKIIKK